MQLKCNTSAKSVAQVQITKKISQVSPEETQNPNGFRGIPKITEAYPTTSENFRRLIKQIRRLFKTSENYTKTCEDCRRLAEDFRTLSQGMQTFSEISNLQKIVYRLPIVLIQFVCKMFFGTFFTEQTNSDENSLIL